MGKIKFKALTKDSTTHQDYKDIEPSKTFENFANNKDHLEYYCRQHLKERLKQYCYQESITDVILSGTDIEIKSTVHSGYNCHIKDCTTEVKYTIRRTDNF